jgi:glutamate decarboxylase
MIADLWHAPPGSKALGTATTGSSEAIMLGGLALKKRWQAKMKAAGKSIHEPGPNIVMGECDAWQPQVGIWLMFAVAIRRIR